MTSRPAALVTDVHLRNAVAGLRALGRAGVSIVAASDRLSAPGFWSRFTEARVVTPSVLVAANAFACTIARVARERGPIVVYPGREEALDALLSFECSTDGLLLPYPAPEVVRLLRHKPSLPALAESVGLRTPRTLAVATVEELAGNSVPLPCVLKEVQPGGAVGLTSAIDSEQELARFLRPLPASQSLLVQERLSGPLIALSLVLDRDGVVSAAFQQQTVRTWPARAGGSSLARSIPLDLRLLQSCARMLSGSGYWGLAQLQFIDGARGPELIDINPRFYGTLPLACAAGVNLPAAWHAVTLDEPVPPAVSYRVGVTYRWLEADISAALQGVHGRLRAGARAASGAMWASDDVVPSALLAAHAVTERVNRLILRRAVRASAHRAGDGFPPA